jgi:hypothetical protein
METAPSYLMMNKAMTDTSPTATTPAGAPMPFTAIGDPRWRDAAWLDSWRQHGDPVGDACARALKEQGVPSVMTHRVIATMKANDRRVPDSAPAPLQEFFAETYRFCESCGTPELPAWVDRDRVIRGQQTFMERSLPAVLVMLCKSLPEGYAAPSMAKILNMSGDLKARPFHRLMGTLQLLLDVTAPYSFERMGMGAIAGQEMRLLHAGVRTNVAPEILGADGYAAFVAQYGVPINQEDMAGTIIGFSLLVVEGLAKLGLPLDDEAAEDYYYVWRVFAHLMGVRAPGAPDDVDSMPQSLADARAFYDTYHRHYVGPTTYEGDWRDRAIRINPDGVALADAHIRMLGRFVAGQDFGVRATKADEEDATGLIGRMTEDAGLHAAAKYVHLLCGDAACARIGVERLEHTNLLGELLSKVPKWWEQLWDKVDPGVHIAASEWLFGKLVKNTYRRGVVYPVPMSVDDLHELARTGQ